MKERELQTDAEGQKEGNSRVELARGLARRGDSDPGSPPPGGIWKHPKTGGHYWRIRTILLPEARRGKGKYTLVPLVPAGKACGASHSKEIARRVQRRLWADWRHCGTPTAPATMETLLDEFASYNANKAGPAAVAVNKSQLRRYIEHAAIARPSQISPDNIQAFLAALRGGQVGHKPSGDRSIQKYRNTIHKFCAWCYRFKRLIDDNPADLVEVRQPARRPPQILAVEEIDDLLAKAAKYEPAEWLRAAIAFGVYGGLRVSEIRNLRWQDVGKKAITVGSSTRSTKARMYRHVPIDPPLAAIIAGMKRGGAGDWIFACRDQRQWLQEMADLTDGLGKFGDASGRQSAGRRWHILRSTYAVHQVLGTFSGKPATLWELMARMGHRTPTTTMIYIDLAAAFG